MGEINPQYNPLPNKNLQHTKTVTLQRNKKTAITHHHLHKNSNCKAITEKNE
jgi:hypothetical protein